MTESQLHPTMKYSAGMVLSDHSPKLPTAVWASYKPEIVGQQYGFLTVVSGHVLRVKHSRYILCHCALTKETRWVIYDNVLRGKQKSFRRNGRNVDVQRRIRYHRYQAMRDQCENPANPAYHRYGGRGIEVHMTIEAFHAYVIAQNWILTPLLEVDRIDNDGHYEAGNLRRATRKEQVANRYNTLMVSWKGKMIPLSEWPSPYAGTPTFNRIKAGLTGEQIVADAVASVQAKCKAWRSLRERLLSTTLLTQAQRNALLSMVA